MLGFYLLTIKIEKAETIPSELNLFREAPESNFLSNGRGKRYQGLPRRVFVLVSSEDATGRSWDLGSEPDIYLQGFVSLKR
jgi:hypothetical protein